MDVPTDVPLRNKGKEGEEDENNPPTPLVPSVVVLVDVVFVFNMTRRFVPGKMEKEDDFLSCFTNFGPCCCCCCCKCSVELLDGDVDGVDLWVLLLGDDDDGCGFPVLLLLLLVLRRNLW